jgi:hypothetical protein
MKPRVFEKSGNAESTLQEPPDVLFRNHFLHLPQSVLGLIALLSLAGWAAGANAQYENVPASQLYHTEADRYSHLKFFGFYASAMESWNYTEELAGFTNLTWIHVGSATAQAEAVSEILRRLRQAEQAGVQAVLSFEPFLFKNKQGEPRPDQEIEDFLVELRAQLEFAGLVDTVAMIYPKDEPFREFVRERDPDFYEQYVTGDVYKDIHRDLKRVNSLIKLAFPEKPLGVILSGYELHHKFFSIPENYDWVGFDCYDNLFRACDDKSFVQSYRHLLDHMQPHQQLMAVPETWATNENLHRYDWPGVLTSRLLHHYEIALNEPRFVAFIPFLWSFDAGEAETPGLGLNQFGQLYDLGLDDAGTAFVELVKAIGLQVKSGTQQYPNLAWDETEQSRYRPLSRVRADLMGISRSGVISAWAVDDGLLHKSLRVQVLVRNGDGQVVHKSRKLRSNVDDPALRASGLIGTAFTGLHGFRYQLPRELMTGSALASNGGSAAHGLQLELLVYADGIGPDGAGEQPALVISEPLSAGSQTQQLTIGPGFAGLPEGEFMPNVDSGTGRNQFSNESLKGTSRNR